VVRVSDDEIEKKKPGLDEFSRMFAAIAEVLLVDLRVKALREEMIDAASALILAPVDVALALQLLEEVVGAVAPRGSTEGQILTRHKVAGVRGDNVEETGFGFRVAESLQSGDVVVSDFHRGQCEPG
jgi:hypothetical protein